jgi:hypothetical protein
MLEDHRKLLYPTTEEGQKKLLKIIKKMLPKGNELPTNTYEAKQVVCPLRLEI